MMATLKLGSQHQIVTSPANAAVAAKTLAPASAAAAKRDRIFLLFILSSHGMSRDRFSSPVQHAEFYRKEGNWQGKFSKYLSRLRRALKSITIPAACGN